MKITVLGTGTCRLSSTRVQSSACIELGDRVLLFDLGVGALYRLAEGGHLAGCRELHIHISHRHTDHLLGLFALLQAYTWSDDHADRSLERILIHCTEEVAGLIEGVRELWGKDETSLVGVPPSAIKLEVYPGPNAADWSYLVGGLKIDSVHLPAVHNHGIAFTHAGKRYGFTGDATELSESLIAFCSAADTIVFDAGHLSNHFENGWSIRLEQIVELAVRSQAKRLVATHMYLRHLQHAPSTEVQREKEIAELLAVAQHRAAELGYQGQIVLGFDRMEL